MKRDTSDSKKEKAVASLFAMEELTDDEFQAVYDWIDAEKDVLSQPLKDGLLKLVNNESKRRII